MRSIFVSERLRLARQEAGLTMTKLAKMTNLAISSISQIEKGLVVPKPNTITAIALALEKEEDYFFLPINEKSQITTPIFFRKFTAASVGEQKIAEIKSGKVIDLLQIIYDNIEAQLLDNIFNLEIDDPLLLDPEDIEALALEIRERWRIGDDTPIRNLLYTLENQGIICCGIDIPLTVDAFSYLVNFHGSEIERPVIFYSIHANYYRQRFTIAHELAHMILHRHVDTAELSLHLKEYEYQANRFAGALLMPAKAFRKSVSYTSLNSLLTLKKNWKVSVASIMFRLRELEIITEARYSNLCIERSKNRWNKVEPFDLETEKEKPYFIHDAVEYLLKHEMNIYTLLSKTGMELSELYEIVADKNLIKKEEKVIPFKRKD